MPVKSVSALPPVAFLVLALAGVPLAIAPGSSLEYEVLPKLLILLAATAGLLCCWSTWYPGAAALLSESRGRWLAGSLLAQMAVAVVSTLLSARPGLALAGSPPMRNGLATLLSIATLAFLGAACVTARPALLRVILGAISSVSGLIALYAIAQYAGWDPLLRASLYTTYYEGNMVRIPGTLGHAVHLASFLAAALLLTYGLATCAKGAVRILLGANMLVILTAIVLSGTRSAVLALVVSSAFVIFGGRRLRVRGVVQCLAGIGALALLIGGFVQLEAGTSLRLRLKQWTQDIYGGPRLTVWRDSLALTAAHPLFGSGPETFGTEFRRGESAELSRAYPDFFQESPHNVPLAITIEQGFCGLLALSCVLMIFVPGTSGPIAASIRAAGVCTFVCMLFIPLTITGAMMLYTMAALLTVLGSSQAALPAASPGLGVRAVGLSMAGLFLLAAIGYWRQDTAYVRIAAAARIGDIGAMKSDYESAAAMSFPAAGDDLWASRQFAAVARSGGATMSAQAWKTAAAASARAERDGDNAADAAYQSALLALSANDAGRGEQKLRQAIEAAPNWYKPHLLLAQLLRFTGRRELSEAEATRALDLAGTVRSEVEKALLK